MKTSRKILGTAVAISIAIGAIPLVRIPTKAEGDGGEVTPSTGVKTIMRGTSGIKPQTTTEAQVPNTNPVKYTYTCDKGSSIYYGSYPQGKINFTVTVANPTPEGTENVDWVRGYSGTSHDQFQGFYSIDPIEWRVLANENGEDLFLLSEKNIDVFCFNPSWESTQWIGSPIHDWLNGINAYKKGENGVGNGNQYATYQNFIDTAFTKEEKAMIPGTQLAQDTNPVYNTTRNGTPETGEGSEGDQIFLLSIDEVTNGKYGFTTRPDGVSFDAGISSKNYLYNKTENHKAINSQYIADGCGKTGYKAADSGGVGYWWLRSPGYDRLLFRHRRL